MRRSLRRSSMGFWGANNLSDGRFFEMSAREEPCIRLGSEDAPPETGGANARETDLEEPEERSPADPEVLACLCYGHVIGVGVVVAGVGGVAGVGHG